MNKKNPLVTVCIPVYNEEQHLGVVLDNILQQDYMNLEVLISDNKSTDKSYSIAQSFADKDPRVHLSKNKNNIGSVKNVNKLLKAGTGKYCMLAGAHDLRQHNMISKFVSIMEQNDSISIVHPRALWIDDEGTPISKISSALTTVGVSSNIARVSTVLFSHGYGSVVYGLMRYSALRKINLSARIVAADILWMAEMSVFGAIQYEKSVVLYCRKTPDAGDWCKYVERIYGCDFIALSPSRLIVDMYETFQQSLAKHFSSQEEKNMISSIAVFALRTRYKTLLPSFFKLSGHNKTIDDPWNESLDIVSSEVSNYLKKLEKL